MNRSIKVLATVSDILLISILQACCGATLVEANEPVALPEGVAAFRAGAKSNGFRIAVNHKGNILSSPDESTWSDISEVNNSRPTFFRCVAHGNDTFVVVGGSYVGVPGVIVTLKIGNAWTIVDSGTRNNLYGVAYGNGRFVAVGDHDTILSSQDGICWRKRNSRTSDTLFASVAFGNGTFVAVGDSGTILTSTDGVKWKTRPSGTSMYLSKVYYDAGAFVAMGADGLVLLSTTDGIAWVTRRSLASSVVDGLR
ncbi:MAG TPA: cell wall-binding protein [Verrucomicrobiae bacterium]|nr:cell wall-binding protein [Verrucomicrobiae bacterium]